MLSEIILFLGATVSPGLGFEDVSPALSIEVSRSSERAGLEARLDGWAVSKQVAGSGYAVGLELVGHRRAGGVDLGLGVRGIGLEVERASKSGAAPVLMVGGHSWRLLAQLPDSTENEASRLELRLRASPGRWVVEWTPAYVRFVEPDETRDGWSTSLRFGRRFGRSTTGAPVRPQKQQRQFLERLP